ncbi:MAG TPA: 16S rRNA (guanine(966)-N(2))-methyltransferase RsmD [Gammaproteobacteria bacterium]|jgi:16S rRNA (guanine966-N2)-methyltransferase|nr:16S rRNA (guanine(966)-N(2))-methyltransferase RsmD [Gammaproteobacteria bacterium]
MARRSNAGRSQPGSVRIIAGEWRGRRIPIVADTAVRPTPDRVRETLFNWLRESVAGARCLDLFAGTGVLGFEALSRGAAEVWFVERDAALAAALTAQAAEFGVRPRVLRQDVTALLRSTATARFDIVFLDPPYALPVEPLLALLPAWLAPGALTYVERPRTPGLPEIPGAAWFRRSHAGAVEYGLLQFAATTAV